MPSTQVEVRRTYAPETEAAILDAVHDSLVAAFAIPVEDKHVRLVVHEPHRFAVPPTLSSPEAYTLVVVDCFAGRSVDAKRALYREVSRRLGVLGIPADPRLIEVIGWSLYDGTGAARRMAGDEEAPPYASGLAALLDGWRLIQAAQLLPHPRGEEFDLAYLKYEFFFEKLMEVAP